MSTTNNQSIQQINTAALRGTREAHQPDAFQLQQPKEKSMNTKVMDFMKRQAESNDDSTFQAGRFFGACEVLCMAGVITADQWQELDDIRIRAVTLEKNGVRHD